MDKSWIIRKVLLDNLKETKTRKGDTVPIQILKNWLIQNSFTYEESTPVIYSLFKEGFYKKCKMVS